MPSLRVLLGIFACLPALTFAQVAVVGKIGTQGIGADVVMPVLESANARVGANWFAVDRKFKDGEISYDGRFDLRSAGLVGDWFPVRGSALRISAGAMYNGNRGKVAAKPESGSTYVFNGVSYNASDIGTAEGTVTWRRFAPYLGIGWGNPVAKDTQWSLNVDVGVMFQGAPQVRLNVDCNPSVPAAQCQMLKNDADAEAEKVRRDYKSTRFYPVVSVGVGRKF